MSGWHGDLADQLAGYQTTAQDSPELSEVLACGAPLLLNRRSSAWARNMLADFAITALAAVPIMAGSSLRGRPRPLGRPAGPGMPGRRSY